jgi:hypothetical protein
MTQLERSGEHQPDKQTPQTEHRGIRIQATPAPNEGVIFQKAPNGDVTISFQGNITIDLPQAVADVAGAVGNAPPDTGYRLIADGTLLPNEVTPASRPGQRDEREVITHHITFAEAPESIIRASETPTNVWYQSNLLSLSATNTAPLICLPVKHPDYHRPIHCKSRNRKTIYISSSAIRFVIHTLGLRIPANGLQRLP